MPPRLKPEIVSGLDILIIRELTGGVYFGEPRGIWDMNDGTRRAVDTQVYTTGEVQRIARVAFDLARLRSNKVASAEKSNVMHTGVLVAPGGDEAARGGISRRGAHAYPCRQLRHAADAPAEAVRRHRHRQSVRRRAVGRGGAGDRLARHAAVGLAWQEERAHRTASPDCTSRCTAPHPISRDRASPIRSPAFSRSRCVCAIRSAASTTRSWSRHAVENVLNDGLRTGDIMQPGKKQVGTREMGDAVIAALNALNT